VEDFYIALDEETVMTSYVSCLFSFRPLSFARVESLIENSVVQLSVTRELVPPNQSELLLALLL
jgi:hypothetical protein